MLELRAINVKKTPAAAAMLLRSVLEATIKWHFDGSANGQRHVGRSLPDSGQHIRQATSAQGFGQRDQVRRRDQAGQHQWFNAAAHNPHLEVKADAVRSAYALVPTGAHPPYEAGLAVRRMSSSPTAFEATNSSEALPGYLAE